MVFLILTLLFMNAIAMAGEPVDGEGEDEDEDEEELTEQERQAIEGFDLNTMVIQSRRLEPIERTTAFAEAIEVQDEATRVQTVAEVLSDAVGVQVRRLGGLGSYGAASIRGSTPSQVPVYLEGVLINAGGFDSVNLGDLSLDTLARIEVYRGSTPAHLGSAGIGGALNLKTREFVGSLTEAAASVGSWNTVRLFVLRGDRFDALDTRLLALVSATTSEGDFYYLNRNGTRFNPDDDRIQTRQNNAHRAISGLLKLDTGLRGWRVALAENIHAKHQGVAGIDSVPTTHAGLTTVRNTLTLRAGLPRDDGFSFSAEASYLFLLDDFDDSHAPHGELGLKRQHTVVNTHAVGGGAMLELVSADGHLTTSRLDTRWERFSHREEGSSAPKDRLRLATAWQHEWNIVGDLSVLPALRIEYQHADFGGGPLPGGLGEMEPVTADDFLWQASMGTRWEMRPGLTLRANFGRYVRTPDLIEMFGDRGAVIGNPDLQPERGINADAGLSWMLTDRGPLTMLRAEVIWFGTWSDDLIVYVQNSQSTVRCENVDAAEILGLETTFRISLWKTVWLSSNYTYLSALNRSETPYHRDKHLPGRPVHEAYAKIEFNYEAARFGVRLWIDLDYAGKNYLDPANMKEDALARLLFGAGLRMTRPREGLSFTVEVKNLLNTFVLTDADGNRRPLRDFEAFPLPGMTVMATFHWRH